MDESEFAIPAGPADLAQEPGRFSMGKAADFSVRDAASVVSALENVRECADAAPAELALSERETLETVYSALRAFGGLHPKAIDTLRAILLDATERLLILVRRVARPGSSSDRELLAPRSALKLHVFLISWMLGAAAAREDDGASAVPAKGKGKGAASKGGKSWDRLATLVALSGALVTAAECELSSLWRLGAPEEPFLHLLTRGACALLERADLAKLPTLRGPALDLLSTVGGRYGQREQVVACCVDLLHKSEHSPAALAELVERLAGAAPEPTGDEADEEVDDEPTPGRGGGRGGKGKGPVSRRAGGSNGVDAEANERLLASLVRELAASATADGGADSAAARAVASFLVEAAERAPAVLLAHVATVAPQLASDSYTVRSGVVHALSLVLVHVSSQRRELAAQPATASLVTASSPLALTAHSLLSILLERILDSSSYTRTRALQAWVRCVEARAVPPSLWRPLAHAVAGRLRDKAAMVRKNALVLLRAMAAFNPFAPSLDRATHAAHANTIETRLAAFEATAAPEDAAAPLEGAEGGGEEAEGEEGSGEKVEESEADRAFWGTSDASSDSERGRCARALALCRGAGELAEDLESALDEVGVLLGAAAPTDVSEALQLCASLARFRLGRAERLLVAALPLAVSKEPTVRAALADAVGQTLLADADAAAAAVGKAKGGGASRMEAQRAAATAAAHRLIALYRNMSLGERAALESLLPSLLGGSADDGAALPPGVLPALWEMLAAAAPARLAASFHGNGVAARQAWADGAAALELLTMADVAVPDVLRGRSDAIISAALSSPFCARLAAAGCAALKAAAPTGTVPQARALVALRSVLAWEPVQGSADERGWYALCQRALDCAFALAPRPELELALALRGLHARALGGRAKDTTSHANDEETEEVEGEKESTVPPAALCRLLVAIAHGAICALVRAERLDKDLKAVRARSGAGEAQDASTVSAPTAKGKKAGKQQEDAASTAAAESALESELGAKAEADEADGEALRLLAERDVVGWASKEQPRGLLAAYAPLVEALCSGSAMRGGSENVRVAAALALSQLMVASPAYCEAKLPLFFALLLAASPLPAEGANEDEEGPTTDVRAEATAAEAAARGAVPAAVRLNLAVALGDLSARYPNLLEPWTSHVHRALRDSDARVRVALLSVVAHLTVHDMVKAKAGGAELALCLLDKDEQVRKRAKMLFLELAQKSSAPVYNLLPELLSKLTAANAPVDDEGFREIFGYLLGFIEKDKQAESLADRLCSRLAAAGSDEERAVRAVAFCLEKLPPSEKSIRRLIERRSAFAHRLSDDDVYASLCEVAAKARRAGKALLTQAADEYEGVLHKLRERSLRGGPADGDDDLERDELGDEAGEDALAELANGTPARGGGRSRPSAAASASKPAAKRASTAKPTAPRVKRGVK